MAKRPIEGIYRAANRYIPCDPRLKISHPLPTKLSIKRQFTLRKLAYSCNRVARGRYGTLPHIGQHQNGYCAKQLI